MLRNTNKKIAMIIGKMEQELQFECVNVENIGQIEY